MSLRIPVSLGIVFAAGVGLVVVRLQNGGERTKSGPATSAAVAPARPPAARREVSGQRPAAAIDSSYGKIPLHFEKNEGQTDGRVKYLARGRGYGLFLTANEAVLTLRRGSPRTKPGEEPATAPAAPPSVVRAKLIGANAAPTVAGEEPLPGKSNYFIGNDPKEWRTDVPQVARVTYRSVWKGIDLTYYGNQGQLEYDFVVAPGADPGEIRLAYEGVEKSSLDAEGNLVLHTAGGDLVQHAPVIYQTIDGARRDVEGRFVLAENATVGFAVGEFDRSAALVIDPVLVYSTYLGGRGADWPNAIAIDPLGNTYVAGKTESDDFPVEGSIQVLRGASDVFVAKLSTSGNALIYSTYLGGAVAEEAYGIAVDSEGSAFVTGWTSSSDFPLQSAIQTYGGSTDAFVTKLSAAGNALIYSTFLGGSGFDCASGIAVNGEGSAYLAGRTESNDFPTAMPIQAYQGASDAFVVKLGVAGDLLEFGTYLGGTGNDYGFAIAVDSAGDPFVSGMAGSVNFPVLNDFRVNGGGNADAFLAKFSIADRSLVYSTVLGGSGFDRALAVAIDAAGCAFITGDTLSTDFPTHNALQTDQGGYDAFVTKLTASGDALIYSTYLGGTGSDDATGIAVDSLGDAFVVGTTTSNDFPSQDPLQGGSGADAFLTALAPDGNAFVYSTRLGGTGNDAALAVAVDPFGNAFVTGGGDSSDFPISNGLYQAPSGLRDGFVAKVKHVWWLSVADQAELEGNTGPHTAAFTVSLDSPALTATTVNYASSDGTATAGVDYLPVSGALTFDPGEKTKTIPVTILGDSTIEPDEGFFVTLSSPVGASIARSQATGAILDDDGTPPQLSAGDLLASEGGAPTRSAAFPVRLSQARGIPVTAHFQTSDGTARTPGDYVAASGTVTIPPWTTQATVPLTIVGDTLPEPRESFIVTLSSPTNATLGDSLAVVTINDDDAQPATTGNLHVSRQYHTATLLPDGRVLVFGEGSAEVFDPATSIWSLVSAPSASRTGHAAALLTGGKVLLAGGWAPWGLDTQVDFYDSVSGEWGTAPPLTDGRSAHTLTALNDGRALVVGGTTGSTYVTSVETYASSGAGFSHALVNPLSPGRAQHTATRLADGRVLVAGGQGSAGCVAAASLFDPASNTWSATGALATPRWGHVATALADGRVLVAGGISCGGGLTNASELYDPATGQWSPIEPATLARSRPAVALLGTGEVLLAAGDDAGGDPRAEVQIYSPSAGAWAGTASLRVPRDLATATALADGRVLVVGRNFLQGFVAELIDPRAGAVSAAGPLAAPRAGHTATLLPDGRVLVTGGGDASCEIYDRTAGSGGTWARFAQPQANRLGHTATLLPSGSVLVAGGTMSGSYVATAGLLDASGGWTGVAAMAEPRANQTATLLGDGRVLVAGGESGAGSYASTAEVFDLATGWSLAGTPGEPRRGHTATRLASGQIVITGGIGRSATGDTMLRSVEIFDPAAPPASAFRTVSAMGAPRAGHLAVALRDGRLLVAGGLAPEAGALPTAEVYDPARDVWTATGAMAYPRTGATATLLWNGKVLVAGGQAGSSGMRDDAEIWDPSSGLWETTGWPLSGRAAHTATLLTSGEILFAGGTGGSPRTDAALFEPTGFLPSLGPLLSSATNPIVYGDPVSVGGTRLRGAAEASSGGTQSSASDLPVVELRSLEEARIFTLAHDALANPPSAIGVSTLPPDLGAGWYHLRVATSGVASPSRLVAVGCSVRVTSISGPPAPVALGESATFGAAAQGVRLWQWQRCVSGCTQESNWSSISGATGSSYTTPPVIGADAGTRFRVVAHGNCASDTSSSVVLNVADASVPTAAVIHPSGGEYWLLSPAGGPPDQQTVTWSMSDDIRVCRVDVSLLYRNSDMPAYAQAPAAGGLPASFGGGAGCTYPGDATTSLAYTVPTDFPSGQPGSLYKIRVEVTDEAGNVTVAESANPFYMVNPNPDSVRTLIVHNVSRMVAKGMATVPEGTELLRKLQELAGHPRVQGLLVDLGAVTSLGPLYTAFDGAGSGPSEANALLFGTGGIHPYLRSNLLSAYTGLKYIVIVGDDRIVPMARIPDGTVLWPESKYVQFGDLTATGTTVGRAFAATTYLTDDPVAVLDTVGTGDLSGSLFLPDLSVGRLVETPPEIIGTIATFIGQDGVLDLSLLDPDSGHKVMVSGYDFLINVATQSRQTWKRAFDKMTAPDSLAPVDGSLVGQNWELGSWDLRAQALRTHLSGNGGGHYGVLSISGHATHYEEGVPGDSGFGDIEGLSTRDIYGPDSCASSGQGALDLSGSVVYAVGCHGGLSVPGSCRTDLEHSLDLPQTMLSRGAVAYVANSGFGWSLKNGIGYGGRLIQILTETLTAGGTQAIGDAVRQAKQRYYLEAPRYDPYDEKSLMQWTLYGLPMYAVKTGIAGSASRPFQDPAPTADHLADKATVGKVQATRRLSSSSTLPSYVTQLDLHFDVSAAMEKHDSAGNVLVAGNGCTDTNGCYYTLNGLVNRGTGSGDLPILPYLVYDSRLSGTSQHGVLWTGADYDEDPDFRFVIGELVSNGGDGSDHGSTGRLIFIHPTDPRVEVGPDSPVCRPSDVEVSSLVVSAGEALKTQDTDARYTIMRRYRGIDLETFYFNDTQTGTNNCDRQGPAIAQATYHSVTGTRIDWAVPASDSSGVWRVVIVYNDNVVDAQGRGRWQPLELTDDGSGTWRGGVDITSGGRVTYVVEAADKRGNVTWVDYQTTDLPSSGVPPGTALAVDVSVATPPGVTVTGIAPASGPVGTGIAITGTHFTGATSVRIGTTPMSFLVNGEGSISALVPLGAATGAITVASPSGTGTSASVFTVTSGGNATVSGGGTICAGRSATIQAALSGVPPWSLTWSDAVTQTGVTASPVTRSVSPSVTTSYTLTSFADATGAGSIGGSAPVTVTADAAPPVVTPPGSMTIDQTLCCGSFGGATAAGSAPLSSFLAGGSALDDCDPSPTRLTPQVSGADVTNATCFGAGTTSVTFRFRDATAKVGTGAASVTVRMYGDLTGDASIDPTDMVVLRAYFNFAVSPGTPPFAAPLGIGDLNHDTNVDPTDLVLLRAYFNFAVACLAP